MIYFLVEKKKKKNIVNDVFSVLKKGTSILFKKDAGTFKLAYTYEIIIVLKFMFNLIKMAFLCNLLKVINVLI
jgi:hypothetical protein